MYCTKHGLVPHLAIHEATHAVIAYARDIPFVCVSIINPHKLQNIQPGQQVIGGGVYLAYPPGDLSWVSQNGDGAVDMLLAGRAGEEHVFGDVLKIGYAEDVRMLIAGMGWTRDTDADRREAFARSEARLKEELHQRSDAILRVADGLTREVRSLPGGDFYVSEDAELSLDADEVVALIAGP